MPRKARIGDPALRIGPDSFATIEPLVEYDTLAPADRAFLLQLQRHALQYFLDNQTENGLIPDRRSNHGRPVSRAESGLCSLTATGMGLIAIALASGEPYRLLTPATAKQRIEKALRTALEQLPHDRGVMPHF